mgnify:CR=1 FL=1
MQRAEIEIIEIGSVKLIIIEGLIGQDIIFVAVIRGL